MSDDSKRTKQNPKTPSRSQPKISDRMVVAKSKVLAGKAIAVAVCGGIGAVEIVKIIRELRRHGAVVTAFFTPSTERFITRLSVEWATESSVVMEPNADVDYLHAFDLVLVAPATLNTIAKSALGLADNAVTLLIATQFGRKAPVLFVPTMYIEMKHHPLYRHYEKLLESWGADFLEPAEKENRQKMPDASVVADKVCAWVKNRKS